MPASIAASATPASRSIARTIQRSVRPAAGTGASSTGPCTSRIAAITARACASAARHTSVPSMSSNTSSGRLIAPPPPAARSCRAQPSVRRSSRSAGTASAKAATSLTAASTSRKSTSSTGECM